MVTYTHEPQYYETDQMAIIHHSNYLRWFESARIEYLKAIGINYADCEAAGFMSPVMEIQCKYINMVRFGDTVDVHTYYRVYNGVKLFVTYEVVNRTTGEVCCTGWSKHCFCNKEGRPISLKRSFPEFHAKMEASVDPFGEDDVIPWK